MKTALLYGALIALANAVLTFLFFFLGYHSDPAKLLSLGQIPSLAYLVILVAGIILAVRARRNETPLTEGFSYGKALGVAVLTGIFSAILGSAFYILYITVLNREFNDVMLQAQILKLQEKGMNSQQIEGAKKFMTMMFKPLVQFGFTLIFSSVASVIAALIVAAFLRREPARAQGVPPPIVG